MHRALPELLPEHFVVVLRPDVPNLLRGPDLIIGGEGRLFAIFKFQAAEQQSPDRLLVRLALARLALPRHTLCVLLWRPERTDGETAAIATHFHSMISDDSPAVLVDHVLNSDVGTRTQRIPGDIQGRQYKRAAALMSLSSNWLREAFPRAALGGNISGSRTTRSGRRSCSSSDGTVTERSARRDPPLDAGALSPSPGTYLGPWYQNGLPDSRGVRGCHPRRSIGSGTHRPSRTFQRAIAPLHRQLG